MQQSSILRFFGCNLRMTFFDIAVSSIFLSITIITNIVEKIHKTHYYIVNNNANGDL